MLVRTSARLVFGKPERVVLELLRSGKEWRIADIVWDSGSLRGLYRRKAAYDGEAVPETSPVEALAERP